MISFFMRVSSCLPDLLFINTGVGQSCYVRDPKDLPIHLDTTQTVFRKIFLFQTKEGEMGKVAKDRLEPTMLRHDLSYSRVLEFINIERKHRDVLRCARRRNGIKNRLRKIFAEIDPFFLELKHLVYLLG